MRPAAGREDSRAGQGNGNNGRGASVPGTCPMVNTLNPAIATHSPRTRIPVSRSSNRGPRQKWPTMLAKTAYEFRITTPYDGDVIAEAEFSNPICAVNSTPK